MAAQNMASPKPDGTAQTMIELLQEINKNLVENLKQQNERIAAIEAKLASASASDVHKESTPIISKKASDQEVPGAAKDDHEDQVDQQIRRDAASKLEV
jgi:hypothetical protein